MIGKWDEDEKVKDEKNWTTPEGYENALNYIIKKYLKIKGDKKVNPAKQTLEDLLDLFTYTLLFDKEFHQFALDHYRVVIDFDEKNNLLDIIKLKN
jgi:hypothetical protein